MKKRYMELDILRGLAIVGVLLIHITASLVSSESGFSLFINQASRFAVPAFVFLSGLGLTIAKKLDKGYLPFLKNQISKLLILYVGWSFVYYIISADTFNLSEFFGNLLIGSNHYHLYYVPLIISLYLLYPVLLKIGKSNLGLITSLAVTIVSQVIDLNTDAFIFNEQLNLFSWVFYFVLGIWFAHNIGQKIDFLKKHRKPITALSIMSLIGIYVESYLLMDQIELTVGISTSSTRPSNIIFSVLFIMMVFSWKNYPAKTLLAKLSKHSYGIYLSHVFILETYVDWYGKMNLPDGGVLYILVSLVIIAALSAFIAFILSKLINQFIKSMNNWRYHKNTFS